MTARTKFLYVKEDDLLVIAPDTALSDTSRFGCAQLVKPAELRKALKDRTSRPSSLLRSKRRAQTPGFQPRSKFMFRSPRRALPEPSAKPSNTRTSFRRQNRLRKDQSQFRTEDSSPTDGVKDERTLTQQHSQALRRLNECKREITRCKQELSELHTHAQQLHTQYRTDCLESDRHEQALTQKLRSARLQGKTAAIENQLFLEKVRIQHQTRAHFRDVQQQVDQATESIATLEHRLTALRQDKKMAKVALAKSLDVLRQFYYAVLKQGSPTRESGLRWVIRALWTLDEPVPLSMFPKFLPEDAVCFLVELAGREWLLAKWQTSLAHLRQKVSLAKDRANRSNQQLLSDVRRRLFKLSTAVVASPTTRTISPNTNQTERKNGLLDACVEADVLRTRIFQLESEIRELSLKQAKDLSSQEPVHVLRCLFGENAGDVPRILIK